MRPHGQMQPSYLITDNNNTTIKQCTKGLVRKWPRGIVWAPVQTSSFYVVIAKKKDCLGLVAVVSNHTLTISLEKYLIIYCRQVGNDTTYDTEKRTRHHMKSPTRWPCRTIVSGRHDEMSSKTTFSDISNGDISS